MNTLNTSVPGRRLAAYIAIIALPFAIATQTLLSMASQGNPDFLFESHTLLSMPVERADAFYWGLWLDPLGYYGIYIPVIIYAWKALRHIDENVADLSSACGIVYCLFGTIGAMTQAGVYEALYASYNAVDATQQVKDAAAAAWSATAGGQSRGQWLMQGLFASVWMVGLYKLLSAIGQRALGVIAGLMGIAWFAYYILASADLILASNLMMMFVVVGAPLWSAWLGVVLLRSGKKA